MRSCLQSERNALIEEARVHLPKYSQVVARLRHRRKDTVAQRLRRADADGRLLFQPRCGVGGHREMIELLNVLEDRARPDILSVTIDSYTRLNQYERATRALREDATQLNGYPLVSHGWLKASELEAAVEAPIEVRHGTPDARLLFEMSIAGGLTSFEGGGIGYNLPYAKSVPLADSLRAWQYVDRVCGMLADDGIVIDRELFGTLTAVLVPPSLSLAMTLIEAKLAAAAGVRCISVAYPQGGNVVQDVAALRVIRDLAEAHLPEGTEVYPVLHEYMGVFPKAQLDAESLILFGALTARLGRATKIITKTAVEAIGIPNALENARGICTARIAASEMFDFVRLDSDRVEEEAYWIRREVEELTTDIIDRDDLIEAVVEAFEDGRLDCPFSTSRAARSAVIPGRDPNGAIRYMHSANLPLSSASLRWNESRMTRSDDTEEFIPRVIRDINYFADGGYKRTAATH